MKYLQANSNDVQSFKALMISDIHINPWFPIKPTPNNKLLNIQGMFKGGAIKTYYNPRKYAKSD